VEPWKTVVYFGYLSEEESWGARLYGTYRAPKRSSEIAQNLGEPFPIGDSFVLDLTAWKKINKNWELNTGLNNLTDEKYFLWSSARRGGGHSGSSIDERNRQPGVNGFLSLTATF
jgi:outer membrane receptor protein involved in Fe transport